MIRIEGISGISCKGIRDNNEDYIIYDKNSRIIVLCDGMGGHGHGELASKTVAQTIYDKLTLISDQELTKFDFQKALEEAVSKLNEIDVYDDEKKMGTTLVVVAINKYGLLVGHVGDSRFYHFNESGIKDFRTIDHTKVSEAVAAEILTEEEASKSPYKNLLTRCVMAGKAVPEIEIDVIPLSGKSRIVLCSDGLVDAVSDNELQEVLIGRGIDNALSVLNDKCRENSKDNYSIIIADLIQPEIINSNDSITYSPYNENRETIICENCGTENNKESNFCYNCGKALKENSSPSPYHESREAIICENCGTEVNKESNFCYNCGKMLKENILICENCGTENNKESNFCYKCGKAQKRKLHHLRRFPIIVY